MKNFLRKSCFTFSAMIAFVFFNGFTANAQAVKKVAFTHNGKYIITAGWNTSTENKHNGIQIWDAKSSAQVKLITETDARCIVISPDDKIIAIANGFKIILYSLPEGNKIKELVDPKVTEYVEHIEFMPDGKTIVAGQNDGYAKFWDIETGTITKKMKIKFERGCFGISPDGKKMVSGNGSEPNIKFWNLETGKKIEEVTLSDGKTDGVHSITFSNYGNEVVTAGRSMPVRWESGGRMIRRYSEFEGTSPAIQYTKDGNNLLICGYKDVFITGLGRDPVYTSIAKHDQYINSMALSPSGQFLLTGSDDGTAILWDIKNGLPKFIFEHFMESGDPGYYLPFLKLDDAPDAETFTTTITDTDVKYLKAERKYMVAKYADSKKMFEEYLNEAKGKIDPNFTPYLYLGLCDYMEKNYDAALVNFKKDLEYDDSRSLYSVAAVYAVKGDTLNALAWLEKDQRSKDAYSKAEILKDKDWANLSTHPEFLKIMGTDNRPAFKKFCDSADYYVGKQDYKMAMQMIDEAIKIDPDNIKGHHGKGSIYLKQSQIGMAQFPFEKEMVIENNAAYTGVKKYYGHQQLGQVFSYSMNFGGAAHYTALAIQGNKTFYQGYPDLATFMIREKNYLNAKKVMLDYNRIAEDDDFGFYMTALVYSYLGDAEKRKQYAQKAIDMAKAAGNNVPKEYLTLL